MSFTSSSYGFSLKKNISNKDSVDMADINLNNNSHTSPLLMPLMKDNNTSDPNKRNCLCMKADPIFKTKRQFFKCALLSLGSLALFLAVVFPMVCSL